MLWLRKLLVELLLLGSPHIRESLLAQPQQLCRVPRPAHSPRPRCRAHREWLLPA